MNLHEEIIRLLKPHEHRLGKLARDARVDYHTVHRALTKGQSFTLASASILLTYFGRTLVIENRLADVITGLYGRVEMNPCFLTDDTVEEVDTTELPDLPDPEPAPTEKPKFSVAPLNTRVRAARREKPKGSKKKVKS
jgi:hypothetical protein